MLIAQSPLKCWNFEILAKIEEKEAKFSFKGFDLGKKNLNYLMRVYL
jgi:hypothetical protein